MTDGSDRSEKRGFDRPDRVAESLRWRALTKAERRDEMALEEEVDRRAMAMAEPARLRPGPHLEPPHPGWQRTGASLAHDGRLLSTWTGGGFADRRTDSADPIDAGSAGLADVLVLAHDGADAEAVLTVRGSTVQFPLVDLLPDGQVLIVERRGRPNVDGSLPANATVHDRTGGELRSFHLGDGIESIQCTPSGLIWVGWFDEGIFGNRAWRDALGHEEPSRSGLARFDLDGTLAWTLDDPGDHMVADLDALNVVGEDAWCCPYMHWPLLHTSGDRTAVWTNEVRGASALLVGNSTTVALAGGYGPNRPRIVVGTLGDGRFQSVDLRRLVLPDGSPLPKRAQLCGRGARLVVITGDASFHLDLDDLI